MVDELLTRYAPISDQIERKELATILGELKMCLEQGTHGDVVEMGCYIGTTSLFLQRLLLAAGSHKQLHVYDSFEGLPEKLPQDSSPAGTQFTSGELAASKKAFILQFKKSNLPIPHIHKGWFEELVPENLPECIAFAFLDGDYYNSIKSCLQIITPRLSTGAVVVVDDYANEALPGAKKAVDEWVKDKRLPIRIMRSLAIINM